MRADTSRTLVNGIPAALAIVLCLVLTPACGSQHDAAEAATFEAAACNDERFRIVVSGHDLVARGEFLLRSGSTTMICGELREGDGGFNAPWSWHHSPATVAFAEVAAEVYTGCPSAVQADLGYWVHQLGWFCPGARIVQRVR